MKTTFGIFWMLGAASAGPLINESNSIPLEGGLAACDTFKNETQLAVFFQNWSNKLDTNGDGSLSAMEFDKAYVTPFTKCYDNYQKTGTDYCEFRNNATNYDHDKNNEISGQEMCGFWKLIADAFGMMFEYSRKKAINNEKNTRLAYEEFSKNHPELISMTKDKFIGWIKAEVDDETEEDEIDFMGELLFMFLDEDMSGVLESYEENILVFEVFMELHES